MKILKLPKDKLDLFASVVQQFGVGRAADVVLTENGGVQHVGSLL